MAPKIQRVIIKTCFKLKIAIGLHILSSIINYNLIQFFFLFCSKLNYRPMNDGSFDQNNLN